MLRGGGIRADHAEEPCGCAADLYQIEAAGGGCKTSPSPTMWRLFVCGLAVIVLVPRCGRRGHVCGASVCMVTVPCAVHKLADQAVDHCTLSRL